MFHRSYLIHNSIQDYSVLICTGLSNIVSKSVQVSKELNQIDINIYRELLLIVKIVQYVNKIIQYYFKLKLLIIGVNSFNEQDILIVEDSIATAELLKIFLKKLGYQNIRVCIDAKSTMSEFTKLYNSNRVPLIFLDYYLPDTDTISLFTQILKMEPNTEIIVATVAGNDEYGIQYLTKHGAYHYIQKPFSFENIKEVMDTFEQEQTVLTHN